MANNGGSRSRTIVEQTALACSGIAFGGTWVPLIDKIGIKGAWGTMIVRIGEEEGHPVDQKYVRKVLLSLGASSLFYIAGSEILSSLLAATGIGGVGAAALNATVTYVWTMRLGDFIIHQMRQPGWDWHASAWTFGSLIAANVFHLPSLDELREAMGVLGFTAIPQAS